MYNCVTNFARTAYNTVSNYFSGGGTNYWQPASANYSGYSYYSGYPVASGAPSSQSTLSYAQIQAIQTAQRQQRLTADYQKATGSKGKPKTKEGQNLLRNWGKSLKNTLTKFCRTSVKVVKDTAKTSVAFGVGTVIQIGENNLIKPVLDKLFGKWQPKEWIEEDPGYARGRRLGNILGFFQAAAEYVAAGAIFTGGNGLSIAGAPVSGGATLAGSAASTAAAAGVFTHATAVLGASVNSMMSGDNYNSGKSSEDSFDLENINSLENANIKNVETYLDDVLKNFTKAPLKKGDGVRYFDGKGNSWQLNYGYKNATDAIHGAPYLKTTINGKIIRIPLTK